MFIKKLLNFEGEKERTAIMRSPCKFLLFQMISETVFVRRSFSDYSLPDKLGVIGSKLCGIRDQTCLMKVIDIPSF